MTPKLKPQEAEITIPIEICINLYRQVNLLAGEATG